MISIEDTLISDDILEKKFVCDLQACKGACCIEGESGAPLDEDELPIVESLFEKVKPFMSEKGRKAVEKKGLYVLDEDGDFTTTLVAKEKECAFVVFGEKNIALCAFEIAFKAGATNWPKPISCHLYPIRITKHKTYQAVNYHHWKICTPACVCGKKLEVPVYRFLKAPLERKFGKKWFKSLESASVEMTERIKK